MTRAAENASVEDKATSTGTLVVVVGPSGVGKDSLMDIARRHFAGRKDVRFVRRAITRPEDAGGEDHDAINRDTFDRLARSGAFAVSWEAHGLCYGIPVDVRSDLAQGRTLIVNGSRSALASVHAAFPNLVVVNVTARADVVAKRLAARGRETATEIEARLNRTTEPLPEDLKMVTIDNSGDLELAGGKLVQLIEGLSQ
ncbi:MAG: phosphonate metabolism protein/1,5-bisphosphokinase (PRPP-forming) PhnN [Agrobacterium albertimagni]|uniref:Ribose 1,5-bisphosphate phosphokinase PhnN n=1 Tax=Agrobacterium albertimagni AOL15 TaxID=1156935 RepID=K2QJB9_9HYPH|nr:phosphonate metabolism protein/1,5-bisphosphokinase (PRPP-forming) PhnN [Agrobacterium albertimagni]EKF61256.1 guanylate kinase [Agrobacterium albertimagni AOL15]